MGIFIIESSIISNSSFVIIKENSTLKEAALKLEFLTEEEFDAWVVPVKMVNK